MGGAAAKEGAPPRGSGTEGLAGADSPPALTFDVEGGIGAAGLFSGDLIPSHALEGSRVLQPVHSREAQAAALGEAPLGVLDWGPVQQPEHAHWARGLNLTAEQRPAPLQRVLGGRLLDEDNGRLGTCRWGTRERRSRGELQPRS